MKKENIKEEEKSYRKKIHKDILKNIDLFENKFEEENKDIKKYKEVDQNKITKTFEIFFRDEVKFTIIDDKKHKYHENIFVKLDKNTLHVSNPFDTYANRNFPESVACYYENDGVKHEFKLKKVNSGDNRVNIECHMPNALIITENKLSSRFIPDNKVSLSLFVKDSEKEIVGYLNNISNIGIELLFDDGVFDSETLSKLSEDKNTIFSIIVDDNNNYIPLLVKINDIAHLIQDKKIVIETFHMRTRDSDSDGNLILNDLIRKIHNQHNAIKVKNKTEHLIYSSKKGIEF